MKPCRICLGLEILTQFVRKSSVLCEEHANGEVYILNSKDLQEIVTALQAASQEAGIPMPIFEQLERALDLLGATARAEVRK